MQWDGTVVTGGYHCCLLIYHRFVSRDLSVRSLHVLPSFPTTVQRYAVTGGRLTGDNHVSECCKSQLLCAITCLPAQPQLHVTASVSLLLKLWSLPVCL